MPTLFFMPWCELRDVLQIGPITVLPYERGKHPAPLGKTKQATLDAILGNYAERAYQPAEDSTMPVKKALLLRWPGDDERDDLVPEAEIHARLQQVQFLVFAALSNRNFARGMDYCNADGLFVTAQHFSEDNPAATSISTRRRDGITRHMVSGSRGKPIFLRPLHASDRYEISMEWRFAEALLGLQDGELRGKVLEAIMLFNRANTDASEVPPTAEVVFLRAALETLLGATHEAADLKTKVLALMAPHLGPIKWSDASFAPQVWKNKWKGEQRPFTAWVRDFCAWRNKGAHGTGGKRHSEPVWSLQNHLLFTSWFMSRVIKCLLVREGRYTLTQDDVDELANIEMFFAYDVMALDGLNLQWSAVLNHVQYLQLGRMLYESTKEDGSDD